MLRGASVLIKPERLKRGATIGVVAPSSPFPVALLQPGLTYLRSLGYEVKAGEALDKRERYLAGDDRDRADDLVCMFRDPEVDAIFVARGGYGSARLLELLDFDIIRAHPKILVGFSDTTALQLGLYARIGLVTYSGLTLCGDVRDTGFDAYTEAALWEALVEDHISPVCGLSILREGNFQGRLLGGCLSLVASLVGTPFMPDLTGAVLVLEDVNEPPYRIDRLLNQLRMAGVFNTVAGVILGEFQGCEEEDEEKGTHEDVFQGLLDSTTCPVLCGLPYGHGTARRVLPIGLPVSVLAETLSFT